MGSDRRSRIPAGKDLIKDRELPVRFFRTTRMLPYFLADSSALKKDKLDNVRCYFEGFFEGHTKVLSFSGETPNPSAFPGLKIMGSGTAYIQGSTMTDDLFTDLQQKDLPFFLPSSPGYSSSWNENYQGFDIAIPNGELFYAESFFDQKVSDRSLEYFLENDTNDWRATDWRALEREQLSEVTFKNIEWQHDKLMMYGKETYLPRYSAWYGDSDKPYTYSGLTLHPKPWNKGLLTIKDKINGVANVQFNSVLMNWYRDGNDYMGWHADDEKSLGLNPVIGSVNFGEARDFVLRRRDNAEKLVIPVKHGTLLVMKGELQHFWEHSVPKRTKRNHDRINLTFRVIKL